MTSGSEQSAALSFFQPIRSWFFHQKSAVIMYLGTWKKRPSPVKLRSNCAGLPSFSVHVSRPLESGLKSRTLMGPSFRLARNYLPIAKCSKSNMTADTLELLGKFFRNAWQIRQAAAAPVRLIWNIFGEVLLSGGKLTLVTMFFGIVRLTINCHQIIPTPK